MPPAARRQRRYLAYVASNISSTPGAEHLPAQDRCPEPPALGRPRRDHGSPPGAQSFPTLLAAAQAGAPWAYRRLFDWLGSPVAAYLRGQGASDPDGLANDVFLRAFSHLARFEGDAEHFRSWVFTIAHHRLVDDRRRERRRAVVVEHGTLDRPGAEDTEAKALEHLERERVVAILSTLPRDQQTVLLLRVIGDLTVDQVATALGKSPGAVKQLQRRARERLRRRLSTEGRAP